MNLFKNNIKKLLNKTKQSTNLIYKIMSIGKIILICKENYKRFSIKKNSWNLNMKTSQRRIISCLRNIFK